MRFERASPIAFAVSFVEHHGAGAGVEDEPEVAVIDPTVDDEAAVHPPGHDDLSARRDRRLARHQLAGDAARDLLQLGAIAVEADEPDEHHAPQRHRAQAVDPAAAELGDDQARDEKRHRAERRNQRELARRKTEDRRIGLIHDQDRHGEEHDAETDRAGHQPVS